MTKKDLLDRQRGFAELRRFEIEENRRSTPQMRLRQLDAIWRMGSQLGVVAPVNDLESFADSAWAKIRRKLDERKLSSP